jgi:rare lipoprotein A (peptidoglycan hydrolase)
MPASPNDGRREDLPRLRFSRLAKISQLPVAILSLGLALAFPFCPSAAGQTPASPHGSKATPPRQLSKPADQKKWGKLEGDAVWYVVPTNSLAKRRAGKNELTAAQNRLPLGTMVRVTHLVNGNSVIVRITDRGITSRHALIDLCKEAAEKLGMVHDGSAHVRLDILSLGNGDAKLGVSPPIATHR